MRDDEPRPVWMVPLPGNFQAVCFFPRLIFGGSLGNNGEERGRRGGREGVKSAAGIWGLSRASEAALVTHLDGRQAKL